MIFCPKKMMGMADKAEKDLDQASDCGWIRALDAAGNPIRISKDDMLKLIRKEMPIATGRDKGLATHFTNPEFYSLPARGTIEIDVIDYGFYSITSNNISGNSCIVCVSYYEYDVIELLGSISSLVEIKLKGNGIRTLVIKSLTDSDNTIVVNRI